MIKNLVLDCNIKSCDLNSNYKNTLYETLKIKYEDNCINENYIIKINKIKDFIHNEIKNGDVFIKILCECDVYKPTIDDVIKCKVNMIHINGIFVNKYNIKILIPNILNTFDINNNICKYKDKIINIDDEIDVIIKQIRFENFNFTCIGNIV